MTTFVEGVSRLLRKTGFLSRDDDDVTTFSDVQHKAVVQLAIIAIQETLNELVADRLIPSERVDGSITFVDGTRVYSLPTDFIRFADKPPFMLRLDASLNSENIILYEYPGGVNSLSQHIPNYREQAGTPISWYYVESATEEVGFWQVPDSSVDTLTVRFSYEKEVMVTTEGNLLPFSRSSMDLAFIDMASRRFQLIKSDASISKLKDDLVYASSKATLISLMKFKNDSKKYGYKYV